MSVNCVAISGNLGRDAELRSTQQGTPVLSFSMCVNGRRRNGDEWADEPNWVDVTVWGNRAEAIAQYMTKGTHVCVKGRLHQNTWKDKQTGQSRSKLEVVCEDIDFQGQQGQQLARQHRAPSQQYEEYGQEPEIYDSDIPF